MLKLNESEELVEHNLLLNSSFNSQIFDVLEKIGISGEDIIFHEGESETDHHVTFPFTINGHVETIYLKHHLPDTLDISIFHSYGDIPIHALDELKNLTSYIERKLIYGNFKYINELNTIEFTYRMHPYRLLKKSLLPVLVSFLETTNLILPHIMRVSRF